MKIFRQDLAVIFVTGVLKNLASQFLSVNLLLRSMYLA